ncbi:MAG: methylase, partial [Oscillospiraceae bacterium]|nr:methylase [Oscillospiraceae bacterium]
MTEKEQKKAAKEFAERWAGKGDEKQETQRFWIDLLQNVLGAENPTAVIEFEKTVVVEKNTKFIDGYIPSTKVLIEQKGAHVKLGKTAVQSDGEKLTPYGQAFRYNNYLPYEDRARWIIVSNFERILIYNMNKPNAEPDEILLTDLPKQFYQLHFLTEQKSELLKKEEQISIDAGNLVGKLYDALIKQYKDPESPETLRSLNMLCVRLVFCLYAEDAQIFDRHEMFGQYLKRFPVEEVRRKLSELFRVLDMTQEQRDEYDEYMDKELAAFPYVNGKLFAEANV